jgi:Bucentaur or craniofacial development
VSPMPSCSVAGSIETHGVLMGLPQMTSVTVSQVSLCTHRFVDKQDFLMRSEVREYEKERDARLNADVRNRSRA